MMNTQEAVSLRCEDWQMVNDVVMGGVSESTIIQQSNGIRLTGYLSTENNGGFNSARTPIICTPERMKHSQGLCIDWRGSDRPFQLIVHLKSRRVREYFRCELMGCPAIVRWEDFEFRARGQVDPSIRLSNHLESIDEVGVLLSDGVDGPWWLEIQGCRLLEG